mmetsp:Transcript_934/g.1902  ORF Transcript_934/g.1902 Transcript_934/m.1902 type:complete len:124 (-) Transcript_934:998-1369(-)
MNGRVLTTHPMQTYLATSAFVGSSALEVMNGFDPSNTTVFVGSLSDPTITEEDLENLFSTFGQVSGTRIVTQKNCAFITFGTHDAAFRSILLLSGRGTCESPPSSSPLKLKRESGECIVWGLS